MLAYILVCRFNILYLLLLHINQMPVVNHIRCIAHPEYFIKIYRNKVVRNNLGTPVSPLLAEVCLITYLNILL